MEISEIRQLDKVVDRLAAAGPSGIAAPHCWFCGKVGSVWFATTDAKVAGACTCDCKDAVAAQEGKRAKPRWVEKDGKSFIVLDPDVIAREHNQRRKRYMPPTVNTGIVSEPEIVHAEKENAGSVNTDAPQAVHADPEAARKAYRAEWMRKRRAEGRA